MQKQAKSIWDSTESEAEAKAKAEAEAEAAKKKRKAAPRNNNTKAAPPKKKQVTYTPRLAGEPPIKAEQQVCRNVYDKVTALKHPMEILHGMTTSFARSKAYDPKRRIMNNVPQNKLMTKNIGHGLSTAVSIIQSRNPTKVVIRVDYNVI